MATENSVIKDLKHLLADTYILYTKTQHFHWNVTGNLFFMLHKAFEEQYEQLADAVDLIAERLRALKEPAIGSFEQFQKNAGIKSAQNIPDAQGMISELLADHEHLIQELQSMIRRADEAKDDSTMDMMIERQGHHQKLAWMLRSSLS